MIGAQAQGFNNDTTGIACLGTFTALPLDEAAMEALARLIGWKLSIHGIPVNGQVTLISGGGATNRYPAGTPVVFERISGHRDANQTTCPGDQLYAQLPDAAHPRVPLRVRRLRRSRSRPPARRARSPSASPASCASPTAPRRRAPCSASSTRPPGAPGPRSAPPTPAPDGAWATSVTLPASGQVRAVFGGDGTRPRLESAPVSIKVVPSMTLTTDKRRAKAGTAFAVSGTLSPAQVRVECLLERQVRNRWVRVQRKRINVRGGAYTTTVRPKTPGLYRVSIIAERRHPPPHAARPALKFFR